ncbi:tetratricopeptide repeat protein [Engelhardtia mirabilis]|uniref:Tetratricopeptide repeat protein n=1 Tax=Engelhardtia mirabilis TaxID=2528011 RepID=A0A518BQH5_9BACT|nr:Tetratricopeptide repeat protein [Planctomycetes bacterium Pla133]QDV03548.1 Tetratricopeptide repeat protein [Planctomycetes bacterium Pla86]
MSVAWIRSLAVAAVVAAAAPSGEAQEDSDDGVGIGFEQHPEILKRTPDELPRASGEPWAGLFELGSDQAIAEHLGEETVRALGEIELAYRASDFPATLEGLYVLLEAQPDLPPALVILGTTYFRLRRYGDAVVAYERLLEVSPSQVWRTQALGHAYYSLGEYERARDHYDAVLAAQPEPSSEAVRGLALANLRLGEEDRALELFDRVLELDPSNWEAQAWIAQVRFDRGEVDLARTAAEAARALAPHEPRPWYILTNVLYDLGLDEQAEATEERWRELDSLAQGTRRVRSMLMFQPDSYALAVELVELCRQSGDRAGVREGLDRMVHNRPNDIRQVDVYIFALDCLQEIGDHAAADVAAEALATDCADEVDTWRRLETYYAMRRDRKRQIEAGELYRRMGGADR